ncbi:hypothetical protein PQR19_32030 [Paraburkholderia strydomiana]|uniref:Uncharacterized protein n=1 Tax=Paraburkholderia strydomiana TaxID=1245417 RepID=A0ABW9CD74_9BURK
MEIEILRRQGNSLRDIAVETGMAVNGSRVVYPAIAKKPNNAFVVPQLGLLSGGWQQMRERAIFHVSPHHCSTSNA